jgi:hypothetical protein
MGQEEETGIHAGRCACQGGHEPCGCNTTQMEDNSIYEGLMGYKPKEKQIGGNHYKSMAIQPYEYITANGIGWLEGNAIKYISRYKQKGGRRDIEKAIHYLELLLEDIE